MKDITYKHTIKGKDHFIKAYFGQNKIGYAWFVMNEKHKDAYLYFIGVKHRYRKLNVGSSLLDGVEAVCRENYIDYIEGKFYPKVPKEIALAFYEKNGYHHFRDGYEQFIGKHYDRTKPQKRPVEIIRATTEETNLDEDDEYDYDEEQSVEKKYCKAETNKTERNYC